MFDLNRRHDLKETGIPWVLQVPKEWMNVRNKSILIERKEIVGSDSESQQLLALTKGGIVTRDINNLEGKVPATFDGYQYLQKDDLLFCLFDVDETPRTVGLVPQAGMITSAYTRFSVIGKADPSFLLHFYTALDDRKALRPLYTGLRKSIRTDALLAIHTPLPPLREQAAIVKYLGHAHARIDRAIAAKHKLVALLEEQKQAVIHQAVTRGLDPSVPLKDSGIPWLGIIPAHWEVQPLKSLCDPPVAGVWGDDPDATNAEDHVICVRVADFDFTQLQISHIKLTTRAVPASVRNRRLLKRGDILVEKSGGGDRTPVGRLVVYNEDFPAITSNFVARYRPLAASMRPMYIANALASAYRLGITWPAVRQTTGIQNLVEVEYRAIPIPIPPRPEQDAIVAKIAESSELTRTTHERLAREIELLREFRTRLTSDVVTGQVDVREIAATLPDLTGEVLFSAGDEFTDGQSIESEFLGADA